MLFFANGVTFASGCAAYDYRPASPGESTPRIMVRVDIEGFVTNAFLDTGAPYVIINPSIAEALQINIRAGIPQNKLLFRGILLNGYLHRLNLRFIAEEGEHAMVDATTFIPELTPGQEYEGAFPSIIGMNSCLERVRFALDPGQDRFYFGGPA